MSAILLAAGYGTRLYPLTTDLPKALLPLGKRVVLDVLMDELSAVWGLSKVVLVTNHRFAQQFQRWQSDRGAAVELVDNGTSTPQTRLGAIRDLLLGFSRVAADQDALVLGTDNLFTWPLAEFVEFAAAKRPAATIAVRQVESLQEATRCAVVELGRHGRVLRCREKPAQPSSLTVGLCVYYFPTPVRHRVNQFVEQGGNVDAPGYFIEWLVTQETVYGFMTGGEWVDIGSPAAYRHAVAHWRQRSSGRRPPRAHHKRKKETIA